MLPLQPLWLALGSWIFIAKTLKVLKKLPGISWQWQCSLCSFGKGNCDKC
jgi:hypothetical protein